MNVSGLNSGGPDWWLFVVVSIPSTVVFSGLLYWIYLKSQKRHIGKINVPAELQNHIA